MKGWLVALLIVLSLGVAGWFGFREYQQRQSTRELEGLQIVTAERGDLVASIGATGQVRSNQSALLTWQTSGIVEQVNAEAGAEVTAGQMLAELSTTSLPQNVILAQAELINAKKALAELSDTALALARAENDLAKAKKAADDAQKRVASIDLPSSAADIDAARASLTLAKNQLDNARKAYAPYENKPENNLIRATLLSRMAQAQQKYDAAQRRLNNLLGSTPDTQISISESELRLAEAQVAELEAEIADLKSGPDTDDAAALQARIDAAQATLALGNLKVPFSATITEAAVKPGDLVSPGDLAFRLDDLRRLLVDVQVSEVDVNKVSPGQEATLTFDAIQDKEYKGRVIEVGTVGRSVQGVTEFTVTIELADADDNVRPGMTAAVNFVVEQIKDVLLVPNRAVRTQEGQRVVYILVGERPTAVPIVLGLSSDTMSQVLRGELKEGDAIVLNPPVEFESDGPPSFLR